MLWQILLQFIFRITFGVALAMAITPSRLVTSGFYRIHLWVLMGANVFASLILFTSEQPVPDPVMPLLSILVPGLAVASYFGSVAWLYERPQVGQVFLVIITVSGLLAAGCSQVDPSTLPKNEVVFGATVTIMDLDSGNKEQYTMIRARNENYDAGRSLGLLGKKKGDQVEIEVPKGTLRFEIIKISPRLRFRTILMTANLVTAGLLLGSVLTAMLLGHWYLNTPSMQLAPLKRLLLLLFAALALRMLICGSSLILELGQAESWGIRTWSIISFRWLAGLVGTLVLTLLTWQTLKIPNTQSATGILYAAVILTFLGELVSQLLGVDMHYPL